MLIHYLIPQGQRYIVRAAVERFLRRRTLKSLEVRCPYVDKCEARISWAYFLTYCCDFPNEENFRACPYGQRFARTRRAAEWMRILESGKARP